MSRLVRPVGRTRRRRVEEARVGLLTFAHCASARRAVADLDSIVAAIAHGFFASTAPATGPGRVVYPVINIPRSDFALRTETTFLFRRLGCVPARP